MGQDNSIPQPQRTRIYKLISYPTFEDLRIAASRWDEITSHRIRYAFGGTFVALFRDGLVKARDIEILVQRDGLKEVTKIKNDNPEYLGITEHNDHVIVVRENETYSFGVSIHCFEVGNNGYPYEFIPPYESHLRTREHGNLEPILRSNYLLYQRLFRFQREQLAATGHSEQNHLKRDILDIRVFLHCASLDQNEPYPNHMIPILTQVVRSWKAFAESNFYETTPDDVRAWMRLGVPLSLYYDVSAAYRGN